MSVEELRKLVPPPNDPAYAEADWPAIEAAIGAGGLPVDYKEYVRIYGAGNIGGFTRVFVPGDGSLLQRFETDLDWVRHINQKYQVPIRAFPDVGGVIPWGGTDNGDALFWQPSDNWSVVVLSNDNVHVERFDGSMTEFLTGVLSGVYVCRLFPEDVADGEIGFEPDKP